MSRRYIRQKLQAQPFKGHALDLPRNPHEMLPGAKSPSGPRYKLLGPPLYFQSKQLRARDSWHVEISVRDEWTATECLSMKRLLLKKKTVYLWSKVRSIGNAFKGSSKFQREIPKRKICLTFGILNRILELGWGWTRPSLTQLLSVTAYIYIFFEKM